MKKLFLLLALAPALAAAAPDIFGAIHNNDIALVKSFLASDPSSATTTTDKGMTPLHYAAILNRQEAAYLLLKAGVSPDILVEGSKTTPLHWAADANSEDVLRLLLKNNAAVDARAKNGLTPLHLAARKGATECVARLLDAGADPNSAADDGNTPLHSAAAKNQEKTVVQLLKRHANPALTNAKGLLPANLANDPATLAALGVKAVEAAPRPAETAPSAPPVAFDAGGNTPAERYEAFAAAASTIRLSDNTLYSGGWSHGRFEGHGVHVINAEGERYEGEFRRGRRNGRGRYVYPNGDVLECDWDDDLPDGDGSFSFATGGTVRGTWKNGVLREGSGTFSTTSGAQSFGIWQDGSLVSSQPVSR